jgi:hypothetical protein
MTVRDGCGVVTTIVLTCGLATAVPSHAQTRDASLLPPEESGTITVAGCFLRGGSDGEYVLASPTRGPVASVPEDTCTSEVNKNALELEHTKRHGMNDSMLGRWIEVSGRLEKETSNDSHVLRELYVSEFRILPVIPPQAAALPAPAPSRQFDQQSVTPPAQTTARSEQREETAVGTSGTVERTTLPKTASPLPMIGLLGLLSLAGGLVLHLYGPHNRG